MQRISASRSGDSQLSWDRRLALMRVLTLALSLLLLLPGCSRPPEQEQGDESVWRAPVSDQAPGCTMRVAGPYAAHDHSLLIDTLREFAKAHGFQERKLKEFSIYSGPPRLDTVFESDRFAIWRWQTTPSGLFYVAPQSTNFSVAEFQQLTNSMVVALRTAFPGRVEVNPSNQKEP